MGFGKNTLKRQIERDIKFDREFLEEEGFTCELSAPGLFAEKPKKIMDFIEKLDEEGTDYEIREFTTPWEDRSCEVWVNRSDTNKKVNDVLE